MIAQAGDPLHSVEQMRLLNIVSHVVWGGMFLLLATAVVLINVSGSALTDALTSVTAVVALAGAALSIRETRRIARQQLTYSYVARASEPQHQAHNTLVSAFLSLDAPPMALDQERWLRLTLAERKKLKDEWDEKPRERRQALKHEQWARLTQAERLRVIAYINFIEEIATLFNAGLLDKPVVKETVAPWSTAYFEHGQWFIDWIRTQKPRQLRDWARMERALAAMPDDAPRGARARAERWATRAKAALGRW